MYEHNRRLRPNHSRASHRLLLVVVLAAAGLVAAACGSDDQGAAAAVLAVTGWWLLSGREGHHSLLARLAGETDATLHRKAGWVLVALVVAAVSAGVRGAITFVRETVRVDRGDGGWFVRWPAAALRRGRGFPRHRGHFDPGQRVANVAFVVVLGTLIGTGVALTTLHGGPAFVWLVRVHRYATYAFVALVAGHVLVASGVLPGYRGVWRAMHLGGRVPAATARRLWPADEGRRAALHRSTTTPPAVGRGPRR